MSDIMSHVILFLVLIISYTTIITTGHFSPDIQTGFMSLVSMLIGSLARGSQ
jgi:uncharacterized MnhB-related membrane protein